jgi:hypothetical protein
MTTLLLESTASLTCPHCGQAFALSDGFAQIALQSVHSASSAAMAKIRQDEQLAAASQAAAIEKERKAAHERALAQVQKIADEAHARQLAALSTQLAEVQEKVATIDQREASIASRESAFESRVASVAAARAAELVAGERKHLTEQLQNREQQLAESRAAELQLRKDKAAVEDRAAALEVEVARKVDAQRADIEAKARAQEQEKSSLDKAELRKTIEDMQAKLLEANQKAEQGSQQLHGEVLELAIEEGLRRNFPIDAIEEVKKGARGGDVLQRVTTRTGQQAGILLWETKRARDFSPAWLSKLKDDVRAVGADVGVLVTMPTALPKDWPVGQQFGICEDLWITVPSTALQLAEALRVTLLEIYKQRMVSAGKGEKMEAVFDYVTSPQFAQKLKAVYETFATMRKELEQERTVTMQRWARREKALQGGVASVVAVVGEVQGLAQIEGPGFQLEQETPLGEER